MRFIVSLAFVLLAFPAICYSQSNKADFGIEVRWISFDFQRSRMEVSDVPESLRQIPVHKNDAGLGFKGLVTVPSDTIRPGMFIFYSPTIAPQVSYGKFTARGGATLLLSLAPVVVKGNKDSTREIQYDGVGIERGDNLSLVYYAIEARPGAGFGWLGEIEYDAGDIFSFLGGYSESRYDVQVTNGWDRNNGMSIYSQNVISSNKSRRQYLGIRLKNTNDLSTLFVGGVYSEKSNLMSSAGSTRMSHPQSYFFNVSLSFTFGSDN